MLKSAALFPPQCAAGALVALAAKIDSPPPLAQVPPDKSDWWSFKPATRPPLPVVKSKKWARNQIDVFILAKLEQEKLSPSPEPDRRTLIQRLCFDLVALPPTLEEVAQ